MKYDFKGLLEDKTAAGTTRWRVRVEGQRNRKIRIPMGPGEPGFDEHYKAARCGEKLEIHRKPDPAKGTLDSLCKGFIEWMETQSLAGSLNNKTVNQRRRVLERACDCQDEFGGRIGGLHVDLPKEAFIHIRDSFGSKTAAADNCIKSLRAAYSWGHERGKCARSAVFAVEKIHRPRGGATPWTTNDIKVFLSRHGPGTMARLWFCQADTTAGRIGDMTGLGPKHLKEINGEDFLVFQPQKLGSKKVSAPVQNMLARELEHHDLSRETFLETEYGKPFASAGSLDNRVRKWIMQAGLVDENGRVTHSQHGIRKGVATAMGDGGSSQFEIMALLGHADPRTCVVYTANVDRRELAIAGRKRVMDKGEK